MGLCSGDFGGVILVGGILFEGFLTGRFWRGWGLSRILFARGVLSRLFCPGGFVQGVLSVFFIRGFCPRGGFVIRGVLSRGFCSRIRYTYI